jgi:hypothetical protein
MPAETVAVASPMPAPKRRNHRRARTRFDGRFAIGRRVKQLVILFREARAACRARARGRPPQGRILERRQRPRGARAARETEALRAFDKGTGIRRDRPGLPFPARSSYNIMQIAPAIIAARREVALLLAPEPLDSRAREGAISRRMQPMSRAREPE